MRTSASCTSPVLGPSMVARHARYSSSGTAKRRSSSATASAAARPSLAASVARLKSPVPISPIGTLMPTSSSVSVAIWAFSFASIITAVDRLSRPAADDKSFAVIGGEDNQTAITTSAQRSRATSTGRFMSWPPSDSTRSPSITGAKTPGIAMLARMAIDRSPLSMTTTSPDTMSVATARKGIGRSLKSRWKRASLTRSRINPSMSCVSTKPLALTNLPFLMPTSLELL